MTMKKYFSQAAESSRKILVAIESPKGQVFDSLSSVGLDVLGILGIPVASSMSLAKDAGMLVFKLCSGSRVDRFDLLSILHDLMAFMPIYSQYQSFLALTVDSAKTAKAIEKWMKLKRQD